MIVYSFLCTSESVDSFNPQILQLIVEISVADFPFYFDKFRYDEIIFQENVTNKIIQTVHNSSAE